MRTIVVELLVSTVVAAAAAAAAVARAQAQFESVTIGSGVYRRARQRHDSRLLWRQLWLVVVVAIWPLVFICSPNGSINGTRARALG